MTDSTSTDLPDRYQAEGCIDVYQRLCKRHAPDKRLSPSQYAVLGVYLRDANPKKHGCYKAFPAQSTVAEIVGFKDHSSISVILKQLQEKKHMTKTRSHVKGQRGTELLINLESFVCPCSHKAPLCESSSIPLCEYSDPLCVKWFTQTNNRIKKNRTKSRSIDEIIASATAGNSENSSPEPESSLSCSASEHKGELEETGPNGTEIEHEENTNWLDDLSIKRLEGMIDLARTRPDSESRNQDIEHYEQAITHKSTNAH